MIKRIDEFIGRAFDTATKHGFHDVQTSVEHQLMLVISEIGEAVEADRKNRHANVELLSKFSERAFSQGFEAHIKDTVEDELADVCIRIFDMCGCFDVRPYRSKTQIASLKGLWESCFGKMCFSEQAYSLVSVLASYNADDCENVLSHVFGCALFFIYYWAKYLGIDLALHIDLKMRYNMSRGYKHGKQY